MKKQTLAKLIILGMVAAMLPLSAFAADDVNDTAEDSAYTYEDPSDTNPIVPDDGERPDRPASDTNSSGSSDTTGDTTTAPAGTVTVTAQVSGSTATVSVSADQIASQVASGTVVVDVQSVGSATTVAANVSADALQAIVDSGSANLTIQSAVGSVTLSNSDIAAIVEAAGGAEVSISLTVEGGVLEISILAGDVEITELAAGVAVSIPAGSYTSASQTDADGNEVELNVSVSGGVMTLTLYNTSPVHLS